MRRALLVLAAATVCAASAVAAPLARESAAILGVATNGVDNSFSQRALELAEGAGARGSFVALNWEELEPSPGRYDLRQLHGLAYLGRTRRLKLLVGIEPINTTSRTVPRDLESTDWDSPRMVARFARLLEAIAPQLNANVAFVSVGNEVDMYLGRRPGEWASFGRFVDQAADSLRRLAPSAKVGVTTTAAGALRKHVRKVAALNRSSDVNIHTYYPVEGDFRVRAADVPRRDFPRLTAAAGGRPVVLQEVGYPDAARLGSSEAKQARFVDHVFTAWRKAGPRIPFLNFLLLHDLDDATCDRIAGFQGRAGSETLRAFLCSLGLRRSNGTAKPAWGALVRGGAALR